MKALKYYCSETFGPVRLKNKVKQEIITMRNIGLPLCNFLYRNVYKFLCRKKWPHLARSEMCYASPNPPEWEIPGTWFSTSEELWKLERLLVQTNKQKLFAILITNAKKERLAIRHRWATCQCLSFGSNIQKPESCNAKCLILQTRLRMVWEWWKANPSWESVAAHHLKQNPTESLTMNAFTTYWILRCYLFFYFLFTSTMSGNGEDNQGSGSFFWEKWPLLFFFFPCSWFIRNVISHPTDILL